MKNGWKLIIIIVLLAILLGACCVGVGLVTGGNLDRIYQTTDEQYNLTGWIQYGKTLYTDYLPAVISAIREAWTAPAV